MRASLVWVVLASVTASACDGDGRPGVIGDDGSTVLFDGFNQPDSVNPGVDGSTADGTTPVTDQPGVDVRPGDDRPSTTSDQPGVDVQPGGDVQPGVDTGVPPRDAGPGVDTGGPTTDMGGPTTDMGGPTMDVPTDMGAMPPDDLGADAGERCTPGVTRQCMWGFPPAVIGVGPCRRGTQTCAPEGVWGMCVGQTEPEMEACNGEDDDCDGVVDNLIRSCGVGACQRMMLACVLGREVMCVQGMPSMEVCNNIDDDCDGMVDEDLTRSCFSAPTSYLDAGVCHSGTQRCSMGLWGACMGEVYPQVEVCNGMDDDCDGVVDNMCRDR